MVGWTLISLRERSQQAAAKRAIEAAGARALALPGLRLEPIDAGVALRETLAKRPTLALCISPAAVHFLLRLAPLVAASVPIGAGVGAGTAGALRRAGFAEVLSPIDHGQQISEGLLAHPRLARGEGETLMLVAAPGGRGVLAPELRARGFAVEEVEVYRRGPARLDARHARALMAASSPLGLLLSSAEALDNVLAQLPAEAVMRLKQARVAASSERLRTHATARGFKDVILALGPQPQALVAALAASAGSRIGSA